MISRPFVSRRVRTLTLACGLALLLAWPAVAWPIGPPREHHPWGRFLPGAWKSVRLVTESFDAGGNVLSISVTETRSSLVFADDEKFTLKIESTVEVAGKRIHAEPQTVTQRFDGLPVDQPQKEEPATADRLVIDGATYQCQVQQGEATGPIGKTMTKCYYCDRVAPHILRRETSLVNPQTNVITQRTVFEVIGLDLPFKLQQQTHTAAHVKSVQYHDKGTSVTLSVTTADVPGGVVSHTSKELDADGKLLRRSTLETLDYGMQPPAEGKEMPRRPRLFRRHRARDESSTANPSLGRRDEEAAEPRRR